MIKINKIYKEDDTYILEITRRNGDIYKVKISEESIPRIQEKKWYVIIPKKGFIYVAFTKYMGNKDKSTNKSVYLHRYLTDAKEDEYVDHDNHDTLDYRIENLVKRTNQENSLNRKGANKNGSTGVRNVSYDSRWGKYIVQLQIDGKNSSFGRYKTLEEAAKVAEEMRNKYYILK